MSYVLPRLIKGFHFYTENGVYAGITATSLYDFMAKLQTVDIKSILFHYPRGDFQKWIEGTLGDKKLATDLSFVKPIEKEKLREQLLKTIQKRIDEIKNSK